MNIGENIRRLRKEKNITQEKLATHLNISCPAISKWECSETYPDITMIIPLASYFGVSTDQLLGFDAENIENKIKNYQEQHKDLLAHGKYHEARELVKVAYKEFPNDFRIIHLYIWQIISGNASNSDDVIKTHRDELLSLCERILDECTIDFIRNGATSAMAKIYKAEGNVEKALEIVNNFPHWYGCVQGQECERLFEKGSKEWWYWINRNFFDLSFFATDKLVKMIWYSDNSFEGKVAATERIIDYILKIGEESNYQLSYFYIADLYGIIASKHLHANKFDQAVKYYSYNLEYEKKFDDFIASNKQIPNTSSNIKKDIVADWGSSNKYNQVKRILSIIDGADRFNQLRDLNTFNNLINKYRSFAKDL